MEMDTVDDNWITDESFLDDDNSGTDDVEIEKCGICMDVIIDRGFLDCCQHWFCFVCIDNWAAITNLCPLCENEFKKITCVPVYDTIGSDKIEDELISRDNDWCIQGTNNTLSFPSYYIDENAVICLGGDGCKLRNGPETVTDDSYLDTSIACDSCDIWYHAFCVGFDPEGTHENSWLCPRCAVDEAPGKSPGVSTSISSVQGDTETLISRPLSEAGLSGLMSVTVADAGETAVVVSLIEGRPSPEELHKSLTLEAKKDRQVEMVMCNDEEYVDLQTDVCKTSLSLSLSRDTPYTLCDDSSCHEFNEIVADETVINSNGCNTFLSNEPELVSEPSKSESNVEIHVNLPSAGCYLSVDNIYSYGTQVLTDGESQPSISPQKGVLSGRETILEPTNGPFEILGTKRKTALFRDPNTVAEHTVLDDDLPRRQMQKEGSSKKAKLKETSRGSQSISGLTVVSEEHKTKNLLKEDSDVDIMSIVQETDHKPSNRVRKHDGAGLRMKKIMRRTAEEKSSKLIENIREEIRETIRSKSTKGEDNLFDPKLLSAFRAAVIEPKTQHEPIKRLNPSIVRAKKSILQKGKSRDNLTKKIYGNAQGRRRRAWNRDCEVEFWKHRCMRASKTEKFETLKSVLSLLRKSSDSSENEHKIGGDAGDDIRSRLYVADVSLFPRKDNIKPLSALTGVNSKENVSNPVDNERLLIPAEVEKKEWSNEPLSCKSSFSSLNCPRKSAQPSDETSSKSDVKVNKRKWAMDFLAKKTTKVVTDITEGKQEEKPVLRGNFPLLAQLPTDMKPILAPCCHNKISISVRQAQLNRLTEHFLNKANLLVIKRTGESELAVADAVNVEKQAADRSNSKLVYVNLCSQVLSQHTHSINHKEKALLNPSAEIVVPDSDVPSIDLSAEEALKLAGLVSDDDLSDDDNELNMPKDEEPDNVFDMDNHLELDIYGDFEYDLDGEDFAIGNSSLQVSRLELEECDSKLKMVFSTLKPEKADTALNLEDHTILESSKDTLCVTVKPIEGGINEEPFLAECEELYGPEKEIGEETLPIEISKDAISSSKDTVCEQIDNCRSTNRPMEEFTLPSVRDTSTSTTTKDNGIKDKKTECKELDVVSSISKKVEAFIKEHIRPLCKSGVITVQQYRWAVEKTTDKVMRYHSKEKNANFLIKEGEKVRKLAAQYIETYHEKECL